MTHTVQQTVYIGKILLNVSVYPKPDKWEERIVLYSDEPNKFFDDGEAKGWAFNEWANKQRVFYPSQEIQDAFLPLIKSIEDKPVPVKVTFTLDKAEAPKKGYAPRGRNKTYHPGLVGIDNLRLHYYMSEPYVVETCQKAGIHIEKIGKHWFVKKEDRQRVVEVCNLEPKQ